MSRTAAFTVALVSLVSVVGLCAEEAPKPQTFQQAVIAKAISLMPSDLRAKLSAIEKEIVSAARSATPTQVTQHVTYYPDKETGAGPSTFAEQFRIARKKVGEHATYPTLAPYLGKLAATIIALTEPYHTDEAALKSDSHAAFEKALDEAASTLKAESDGNQKVDNPSDFAVNLAKAASRSLTELKQPDADTASIRSSVFSSAANGVTDCWWTLLAAQATAASSDAVAAEGDFVGNKRSLKFHLKTCKFLPAEKNRIYFRTREEAIAEGYVACKVCKP